MLRRIRFFTLAVRATVNLLCFGAFLVVLGFFDQYLGWDIFSPAVEQTLLGVFAASVALGAFGAAISLVLGIQEMVQSLHSRNEREVEEPASPVVRRRYGIVLSGLFLGLVLVVWGLNVWNHHVLEGRQRVFKRLAREQMQALGGRFRSEIERAGAPCPACTPTTLGDLVKTFQSLSFCRSIEIYRPDPADRAVLWRYPAWVDNRWQSERLFIARDVERAVSQALRSDPAWIDQMNRDANWVWYQPIRSPAGILAVVKIEARPEESFRDYRASASGQPSTHDE